MHSVDEKKLTLGDHFNYLSTVIYFLSIIVLPTAILF